MEIGPAVVWQLSKAFYSKIYQLSIALFTIEDAFA